MSARCDWVTGLSASIPPPSGRVSARRVASSRALFPNPGAAGPTGGGNPSDVAMRDSGEVGGLLRVGSEQGDGAGAEPLHGEGEVGDAGVACQRLADEGEGAHVEAAVAVGDAVAQPACLAEVPNQPAAGGIDV